MGSPFLRRAQAPYCHRMGATSLGVPSRRSCRSRRARWHSSKDSSKISWIRFLLGMLRKAPHQHKYHAVSNLAVWQISSCNICVAFQSFLLAHRTLLKHGNRGQQFLGGHLYWLTNLGLGELLALVLFQNFCWIVVCAVHGLLGIYQLPPVYPAKYRNLLSAFIITNCENIENRGNFYMSKICKFSVNYCDIAILIPIEYNEWAYELATRTQLKLNIDSGLAQNTLTPSPIKHTRCPMNSGTKKRAWSGLYSASDSLFFALYSARPP